MKKTKNKIVKLKKVKVDVRSSKSLYVSIGNWTIYIDDSTHEKIISTWVSDAKQL